MPIINNLKTHNTEPINITRADWLNKVNIGEITDDSTAVYHITDDFVEPSKNTNFTPGDGLNLEEFTRVLSVDDQYIINIIKDTNSYSEGAGIDISEDKVISVDNTYITGLIDSQYILDCLGGSSGLSFDGSDGIAGIKNGTLNASTKLTIMNAEDRSILSMLTVDKLGRVKATNGFTGPLYVDIRTDDPENPATGYAWIKL